MQPTETELKLRLDPQHVARLKDSAALAGTAPSETEVLNVYFDTSDRLLQRHSMALRVRQIDGRWLQTLKIAGKRGALSRRGEWETPARVVRGAGRLDLARFENVPLRELLASQETTPQLRTVFQTRFGRTRWSIKRADALIEVALDIGEITAGKDGAQSEPICEVELELKTGNPAALIETAFELLDVGGKTRPRLTPVARSKAERGYQLVSHQPATAIKASAKGFVAGLTRQTTTADALRIALAHGVAVLTANAELLMQLDDPELIHQARVALRRVRSAIRLLDAEARDVPPSLSRELRWLARALGAARDWDVIVDQTLPSLVEAIGAKSVSALQVKAGQRRQRARTKIVQTVGSARYCVLVLNAEYWCMTRAGDAPSLGDSAAASLQDAARRLFKAGRFFTALTPERRHRVRILAKRLRYALDLFAVALPKQATAQYIEALAQLQDVLGHLNDGSVALTVLPQLSKSDRMKESIQNWWSSIELELVRDSESRLLQLSKMDVPW
ncbi:MAG: CHAD domain-containing protein [Pseudomonadota bacterium]|nr:CHAD domain-containing protein [Pseudomonadota bacterium]